MPIVLCCGMVNTLTITDDKERISYHLQHGLRNPLANQSLFHIDGLMQDCSISSALAVEILQYALNHRYDVRLPMMPKHTMLMICVIGVTQTTAFISVSIMSIKMF